MKNTFKVISAIAISLSVSNAATIQFTNTASDNVASGFGDTSGTISSGLIWGVIVDTGNNGFATGSWTAGFNYSAGNTTGIALVTSTGAFTDDVLYINTTVTSNLSTATDGAAVGTGRVNTISTLTFGAASGYNGPNTGTIPTVAANQNFGIVWFDRGISLGTTSTASQKFGFISAGTNASPAFVTPASNGDTVDYSAAFDGVDPVKTTTFSLQAIPEPSSALLGAFGALALLRRRRK